MYYPEDEPESLYDMKELSDGTKLKIASSHDLPAPTHGEAFGKPWNRESSRQTLSFYDSTVEYMRNVWTQEPENARSQEVTLGNKTVLLFFDEHTRTWNSPEALDVDHITPWRTHLEKLEVWSREDAMLAYNDLDNLRTVPATYNRARSSADAILEEHGADSKEWKDWVDKKMRFDVGKDYPAYDPDVDGAKRTSKTTDVEWTSGVTRKGLQFDESIKTKWLDHALKEAYVGEVKVPDPDHQDDRSMDHTVQLFRCAATGQLVTQGGLDIDHEIPFTVALKKMLDMQEEQRQQAQVNGDDPPPPITKADVLDLYNNPENLRLMSRSANSAHEWEIGIDGHYYDPELDGAEYAKAEPTVTVVDDHEPLVYEDEVVMGSHAPVQDDDLGGLHKRDRGSEHTPNFALDDDDENGPSPTKRTKEVLSPRETAMRDLHTDDALLFGKAKAEVEKLDPVATGPLSSAQQENLAMALVYGARGQGIGIDHVAFDPQSRQLFGVQGPLDNDTGKTFFPLDGFKNVPLEVTAGHVAEQRRQAALVTPPVQPQQTPTHTL